MKHYDAIVIGGGVLGCMTARNLRRWNISTLLLEKEEDICKGITRANSAICYAGYDNKPGSLKAELTVRGNANMEPLCKELDVPFTRCGSLLVTYNTDAVSRLKKKLQSGIQSGVPGLQLLSGTEAETLEPGLRKGVAAALYAPSTSTVNPWLLGIAAFENAIQNGVEIALNEEILSIQRDGDGYILTTNRREIPTRYVINCAGIHSAKIAAMVHEPHFSIHPRSFLPCYDF